MPDTERVPLTGFDKLASDEALAAAATAFLATARKRRSVRDFSDRPIPRTVIESCLLAAGSAPSGANQQPWHFAAVNNADKKREIRIAAEQEEHEFYHRRAPQEWLDALSPIGTDENKPFLEIAPWLIAIFAKSYTQLSEDSRSKNYYVNESVGIATGTLLCALNQCGLATLTHTPSPMKFLNRILERPSNERPFLLLVVGFPGENCTVPNLEKKPLEHIASFF